MASKTRRHTIRQRKSSRTRYSTFAKSRPRRYNTVSAKSYHLTRGIQALRLTQRYVADAWPPSARLGHSVLEVRHHEPLVADEDG